MREHCVALVGTPVRLASRLDEFLGTLFVPLYDEEVEYKFIHKCLWYLNVIELIFPVVDGLIFILLRIFRF